MHGPGRKRKPDQRQGEWDGEQVRVLETFLCWYSQAGEVHHPASPSTLPPAQDGG